MEVSDLTYYVIGMKTQYLWVTYRDHPFKTSACLRGEGCTHVPMVQRSHYIRIKNPLDKHFAGMPMVGGKNLEEKDGQTRVRRSVSA